MGDLIEPLLPSDLTQAPPPVDEGDDDDDDDEFRNGSSAKIDQLVYLLRSLPTNEKSLVFSQFTSFLDKVRFGFAIFRATVDLGEYFRLHMFSSCMGMWNCKIISFS